MANKIRTTHVGSLPRSQDVVDFIFSREKGEQYDQTQFDKVMSDHVAKVVAKQVEAGIDIVSDGETSKISYATYVKDRYNGFGGDSERNAPADLKLFPDFLKKLSQQGGTPEYSRPVCNAEISTKNTSDLNNDISNLTTAINQHKAQQGFMNAASPGVISLFLPNKHYSSREKYLQVLGDVMKQEYETIVDSGLHLQLDCPDLALSRHMLFTDLSDEEFVSIANLHVEVLNHALRDIDKSKVRVHICWGNYEGPHICDIPMNKMFDTLMKVDAQYLLFETSNPRHAHEWTIFRDRKSEIPQEKVLIPGVIDSTTNFVEHPELIAQRLQRFTDIVGKERVIAGSDCGFGTFAGFGAVAPDIAYAKLASLVEGASLASSQ
ncbi:cobalamin-independent methionine synthase II family protein [Agarilytica rhodophyticola]|uniref:cobalamin-independent methionine synthase II family protein n=1 Tax=Agarilytica rhodophyticola TaxID=1737490 RepID=UPI000B34810B|nr:cobalamin-independent methionine synthase II family protein [Agarilytica rhodophyticola]